MNCTCGENSVSCNITSGSCECKDGWNGTTCDDDINECEGNYTCPDYSTCENANGSYNCPCNEGYTKTADEKCIGTKYMTKSYYSYSTTKICCFFLVNVFCLE